MPKSRYIRRLLVCIAAFFTSIGVGTAVGPITPVSASAYNCVLGGPPPVQAGATNAMICFNTSGTTRWYRLRITCRYYLNWSYHTYYHYSSIAPIGQWTSWIGCSNGNETILASLQYSDYTTGPWTTGNSSGSW